MALVEKLGNAVRGGKKKDVELLVGTALADGTAAGVILDAMLDGMHEVGERFKSGEAFVPEVLIAARALNTGIALLEEKLKEEGVKPIGKIVIGTVKGDLHDIGKNLVRMMLQGANFEVIDLGVDVSPERFVEAVRDETPQILALSSLLTTSMPQQKKTVQAVVAAGLRDAVKIIVGGAPVTQAFCDSIGADGYSGDAASAADLVKRLLGV